MGVSVLENILSTLAPRKKPIKFQFVDIREVQLREFLVPTMCLNEIRALHCLAGEALDNGLHGLQIRSCEKHVDFVLS